MELTFETLRAHTFALEKHAGQTYGDGVPYSVHLTYVVGIAEKFLHYVPAEKRQQILQAAWLHDCMEDCGVSYNDLVNRFGEFVAEIVFSVSNEMERDRKAKMLKTLPKTALNKYGRYIKICDRVVNLLYSKLNKSSMYKKYCGEAPTFKEYLYVEGEFPDMWALLDELSQYKDPAGTKYEDTLITLPK